MQRRDFFRTSTLGIAGGLLAAAGSPPRATKGIDPRSKAHTPVRDPLAGALPGPGDDWDAIRNRFAVDRSYTHMAGLFLASHPEPVANSIQRFREALDRNPTLEVLDRWGEDRNTRTTAARYMGAEADEVGLTMSTTMGLGIVVHGIRLSPGSEILQTTHDHSVANRAIEHKAEHAGATVRRISLYDNDHPEAASRGEILERLRREIRPETRIFLATWVHSRNGVKLPLAEMGRILDEANATRAEADRVVFVVDGVHGFGIEDIPIPELGCDFFAAGSHKWIFAPRGTGIIWGHPRSHHRITPIIPAIGGGGGWGGSMSPGGFHAFEHRWAIAPAFEFHLAIGKGRVQGRIHALNSRLKEGLREMPHIRLYTPMEPELSSGLTCFDVSGMSQGEVVAHLRDEHRIIASTTPYSPSYARLTPGLLNDEEEVDRCLDVLARL